MELCLIAERLNRGCVACSSPLELINCVKEQRFGLASVIHIRCSAEGCRATTMVQTSKTHTGRSGTCRAYDVNTKAALGKFIPHSQHLCQSSGFQLKIPAYHAFLFNVEFYFCDGSKM